MIKRLIFCFLFLQTLIARLTLAITRPPPLFNLSHFIYPKFHHELRPQPSLFLKDVIDAISERQKWQSEDVRVSRLDSKKVKYGTLQRYEIGFRYGKSEVNFELWDDEVSKWKKLKKSGDFEIVANEVSSNAVLDAFKIKGPFELRVKSKDELQLMLPHNSSHVGLKRVVVGDGITVEVRSAQEVSLLHNPDLGLKSDGNFLINKERGEPWLFGHSSCSSLFPINILGSASLVAYRTQNPDSYIDSAFLSRDTIELLPEKCYFAHTQRKRECPINSLRSRLALLEKVMRSLSGNKTSQNGDVGFFKAKAKAETLLRFQLKLERKIRNNGTVRTTLADWKTRPTVEHVWFEIVARNEAKRLKPLLIKKVRHVEGVDTSPWSNLMSNISFTKIPSVLVPPEALTLDVKW